MNLKACVDVNIYWLWFHFWDGDVGKFGVQAVPHTIVLI